ncbi:sterol O-acyltransferase 1-like [Onthophagus taurus]|uniref:sterol O-acyltransferase 1-like n=1 Tax=Onthophagus taurus TaxID=166361 RepID=UPI000C20C807|nr:sterol O-acyltransferase 1-like [Onthophagus taurus]
MTQNSNCEEVIKPNSVRQLHLKQFKERKSVFTELSKTKHFLTVKHLFYCILFGLLLKDVAFNFILNKKVDYGLRSIMFGYAKFHIFLILWYLIFTLNVLTFTFYNLWVTIRKKCLIRSLNTLWVDCIFFCLLIGYYIGSLYGVPVLIRIFNLPILSAGSLLTEQVRLIMKSYSFIRRNVPEVLNYKPHRDKKIFQPKFSHYIYFLFVPTLIYRHKYPRTKSINWNTAIHCFLEVIVCIWLQSYTMDYFFVKKFETIGIIKHDWSYVIIVILEGAIGGFLLVVLLCYQLLHNWMNGFAEILKFGDRKFYDDWWTATNFQTFFRKWNIIVQDWLYEYIYKDFSEKVTVNNKVIPKIMVFLVSAIVHEYILTVITQQFFPFLFVNFFIFGMIFSFLNTKHIVYNILFLYGLSFGFSLNVSFYTMESFARKNCHVEYNTTSQFLPRIFSSQCINALQ